MAAIFKIQNGGRHSSQITCLHFLYDSNNKKLSIHKSSCFYDNLNNLATNRSTIIGYCINTTFYDRGHVSDALPSLRGNALPRHERGHKMLYLYNNLIMAIIYPYKIIRNHADT